MDDVLLDTDILSEVLRAQNPAVAKSARNYFQEHGQFTFSSITRYEIIRGLKVKDATRLLANFTVFCERSRIIAVTDGVLDLTADLWVSGRRQGHPHQDADLIIAATAIANGLTLITGNTAHFDWIPDLNVGNWRVAGD
jgi:tRNA(fMet)-specific endonuclease VapC